MIQFNKETFYKALDEGKLMMVDFWAEWCGYCVMLSPVLEDLAQQYEGRVVAGKVNTDEVPELAMRYSVMNLPTVIFFKDGKEIDRLVGAMPPDAFIQVLEKNRSPRGPPRRSRGGGPLPQHERRGSCCCPKAGEDRPPAVPSAAGRRAASIHGWGEIGSPLPLLRSRLPYIRLDPLRPPRHRRTMWDRRAPPPAGPRRPDRYPPPPL